MSQTRPRSDARTGTRPPHGGPPRGGASPPDPHAPRALCDAVAPARLAGALVACALWTTSACGPAAPTVALDLEGSAPGDRFGITLAAPGDLDGDGVPDLAVGADQAGVPVAVKGYVAVFSGADGRLLYEHRGVAGGDLCGASLAVPGDLDGDGRLDLAVGSPGADVDTGDGATHPDAGRVDVLSGADGRVLHSFSGGSPGARLGTALAVLGDVDGDDLPDLAVSAPAPARGPTDDPGPGAVSIHSGRDGAVLLTVAGAEGEHDFGALLAAAGDRDGDGLVDLAVTVTLPGNRLELRIVSGRDGRTLGTVPDLPGGGVSAVTAVGDLDGDGVPDLALGHHLASEFAPVDGVVEVRSASHGAVLWWLPGRAAGDGLGRALAVVGDLDGDGQPDLATSARGPGDAGRVDVLSGADGTVLFSVEGAAATDRLGASLVGLGDLDGDGVPELAAGAQGEYAVGRGRGRVLGVRAP